jgi:glycine betaine/proline transport system ATP-binding protein
MKTKIAGRNLYKIFGGNAEEALKLLQTGKDKDEIFEATGQTVGVNDVSFQVAEGEIFVVMGLSGSGKSTLVRMINGLIKPSAGEILIDGIDVGTCSDEQLRRVRREKVAMVFQHFALFPHKTVADNVAFGLKIKGMPAAERRERAQTALEQVGLGTRADSYPDELSGGMQQRVGLARGLASEPEILLMDEPFSALDPLIRSDMQQELIELQRSLKKTIVFITHDLNEALTLGSTIAIMRNGAIVQTGSAEEIVGNPADDYVASFTRDIDRSRVFEIDSVTAPAEALKLSTATRAEALAQMDRLDRDALYVVDDNGRAEGIVTYRQLASASSRKDAKDISAYIGREFRTIRRDAHLNDMYALATDELPIAVVEGDRLVGIVEPHAVFRKLTADGEPGVGERAAP